MSDLAVAAAAQTMIRPNAGMPSSGRAVAGERADAVLGGEQTPSASSKRAPGLYLVSEPRGRMVRSAGDLVWQRIGDAPDRSRSATGAQAPTSSQSHAILTGRRVVGQAMSLASIISLDLGARLSGVATRPVEGHSEAEPEAQTTRLAATEARRNAVEACYRQAGLAGL